MGGNKTAGSAAFSALREHLHLRRCLLHGVRVERLLPGLAPRHPAHRRRRLSGHGRVRILRRRLRRRRAARVSAHIGPVHTRFSPVVRGARARAVRAGRGRRAAGGGGCRRRGWMPGAESQDSEHSGSPSSLFRAGDADGDQSQDDRREEKEWAETKQPAAQHSPRCGSTSLPTAIGISRWLACGSEAAQLRCAKDNVFCFPKAGSVFVASHEERCRL